MLKVVLKRVGEKAKLVDLDVDKTNGFAVPKKFDELLEVKWENGRDRMCIDKDSSLYLYVAECSEGANFDIATNNPYMPIQTIMGHCLLTKYLVDEEGYSEYEDMTENELELVNALVDMNNEKAIEHIRIARENLSDREKELIADKLEVQRRMAEIFRGFGY